MRHLITAAVLLAAALVPSARASAAPSSIAAVVALTSIHMTNARSGWGENGYSLFHTDNGGQVWRNVTPRIPGRTQGFSTAFIGTCRAWLATTTSPYLAPILVYRTANCGQSWQRTRTAFRGAAAPGDRLSFANARDGWLLVNLGAGAGQNPYLLIHSTDGGIHWFQVAHNGQGRSSPHSFPGCDCTEAISFHNAAVGWSTGMYFAVPNQTWLWRTTNGGRRWQQQHPPVPRGYVAVQTEPPIFFGNGFDVLPAGAQATNARRSIFLVYRSGDGGRSWHAGTPLPLPGFQSFSSTFVGPGRGWVASGRRLYSTASGGQHWTSLGHALPAPVTQIQFVSTTTGFAVPEQTSTRPATYLLRTDNGGHSWRKINTIATASLP